MNIILNGAGGHMGREVLRLAKAGYRNAVCVAGVDINTAEGCYASLDDYNGPADVIVDFSFHSAVGGLLDYAINRQLPVVIATTGHDGAELALIAEAALKIPVFHAANMSMGVALLAKLAATAAKMFPEADIEIVETHHRRKADAPSGTALMLAQSIREVRPDATFNLGRSGYGVRTSNEIGVNAVRRGNIAGIHEILISTDTQTLTLKHEVHDRALLAEGALAAAVFLIGREAGLYDMNDMMKAEDEA